MNDTDEFIYALDRAVDVIQSVATAGLAPGVGDFCSALLGALTTSSGRFYIFSLTEDGDSLNQWRSYTSKGPGYALGFASENITTLCLHNDFRFGKCIYSKEEVVDLIAQLVRYYTRDFEQYFPLFGPGEINEDLIPSRTKQFTELFFEFAALIKNPAFKEELEWRIIAPQERFADTQIAFKSGPHSIVPYARIQWDEHRFFSAFQEVVIKPCPHMEISSAAIKQYVGLEHRKLAIPDYETESFEITRSIVPYREGS